jgi:hypothetical protein
LANETKRAHETVAKADARAVVAHEQAEAARLTAETLRQRLQAWEALVRQGPQ